MKKNILTFLIAGTLGCSAQEIEPPLSEFRYDNLKINLHTALYYPVVRLEFDVTNTKKEAATEIPRVHYQCPACPISKALGVSQTGLIQPGQTVAVKVILPQYDIAVFDEKRKVKTISKGEHRFVIRSSGDANQLDSDFVIDEDIVFPFKRGFSDQVFAKWVGERKMELSKSLTFFDEKGKRWRAPRGAVLNGATIPRILWSVVGSPFIGKYRRASAIHDYYVGEAGNPKPLNRKATREADRMFFEACLSDGCDVKFAATLYAGARLGSRLRANKRHIQAHSGTIKLDLKKQTLEDAATRKEFLQKIKKLDRALEKGDLDKIDAAFPVE